MAVAALLFNWQVLPRLGGRALWREAEHGAGYPIGILLYPLSVLALVLAFRDELWMVAAVWGLLAVGDGMASIVGQTVGGPRLPWNPRKGWAGFAAFVLLGGVGGGAACPCGRSRCRCARRARSGSSPSSCPSRSLCALVESLPTTLDDNLTVPLVGGIAIALLARADFTIFFGDPGLGRPRRPGPGRQRGHRRPRLPGPLHRPRRRALRGRDRHRHHRRPRAARPRRHDRVLRRGHGGHEARLPRQGAAGDRAGEGRGARLAQRLGQRRRAGGARPPRRVRAARRRASC